MRLLFSKIIFFIMMKKKLETNIKLKEVHMHYGTKDWLPVTKDNYLTVCMALIVNIPGDVTLFNRCLNMELNELQCIPEFQYLQSDQWFPARHNTKMQMDPT
jgi:hypothetical protein